MAFLRHLGRFGVLNAAFGVDIWHSSAFQTFRWLPPWNKTREGSNCVWVDFFIRFFTNELIFLYLWLSIFFEVVFRTSLSLVFVLVEKVWLGPVFLVSVYLPTADIFGLLNVWVLFAPPWYCFLNLCRSWLLISSFCLCFRQTKFDFWITLLKESWQSLAMKSVLWLAKSWLIFRHKILLSLLW